jgi:uncharacterized membrane protein YhdT
VRALLLLALLVLAAPALAAGGGGEAKGPEGGSAFVEMTPIILPIVDGGRVVQSVSIIVSIETASPAVADRARALRPKLVDAFLTELYGLLNERTAIRAGVVQVDVVKARLLIAAERVLGEGSVTDVLLQVVQQQAV